MNALLDRFYEDVERAVKKNFEEYFVKLSEFKSSYFVLIKRQRIKILGMKRKILFRDLQNITQDI